MCTKTHIYIYIYIYVYIYIYIYIYTHTYTYHIDRLSRGQRGYMAFQLVILITETFANVRRINWDKGEIWSSGVGDKDHNQAFPK